jgi:membrane protein YqaA with SNARE-associated domain
MLLELFSLLAFSFAGGIVWVFSVETAAVVMGASGDYHPLVVGLVCAGGQSLAYTFLFFAGDWLFTRWKWAGKQVDRTEQRWGEKLGKGFLLLTIPAALVGLPPMTGMAALAGGFRVRFLSLICIAFSFRLVRFVVLASVGVELMGWWETAW